MSGEELLSAVERDPVGRLKWLVLRRLGVSPASWQARLFSGRRAAICACHMLLDRRGAATPAPEAENGAFDMKKFEEMRRAACCSKRRE